MNSLMDLDIHCWTSRYSLLDIRYSLMNLGFIDESWIHWWILDSLMNLDIHCWTSDIHCWTSGFFFVPETLNPIFLGKYKKTRAGKWSRSVFSKVNLEPYDAIWCQFGSQFSSPKTSLRVKPINFQYFDRFFFWNSRNFDNFPKIVIFWQNGFLFFGSPPPFRFPPHPTPPHPK